MMSRRVVDAAGWRFTTRVLKASTIAALASLIGCVGYDLSGYPKWDAKIKELCERDGGVTVYERITLSSTEDTVRDDGSSVMVPRRQSAVANAPYVSEEKIVWLSESKPRVYRSETSIIRVRDGKILSKLVSYGRVGGDFVRPYSCRDVGTRLDLERQTFQILEKAR
jgi:hypothetical protein